MLNYPVMYSLSERERVAVNVQGTVFTLARLKIVHSYHQELVSHPMPEHVEELSSLVRIILQQPFSDRYYHAGHVWVQFLTFGLRFCSRFLDP